MLSSLYRKYLESPHNYQKVWLLRRTIQTVMKARKFGKKKIRPKMLKIEEDDYGIVNEWSNPEDQWVLMSDQDVGYCNPCCQLANGEISAGAGYPVVMKD